MGMLLEAKGVCKGYAGVTALDSVSLSIAKGEVHCLLGENGSGKSTLIKVIGGACPADGGSIHFAGVRLHQHGCRSIESIRAGIQIIYQDLSLLPNLTVAENIAVNQMLESNRKLVSWSKLRAIASSALAEIGERIDLDERVENLSTAKKQIVAISRALTQNAKLIIMDEATSAITREEVEHLFSIIGKLQSKGISTLFVSHKLGEVFRIAQRATILRDGRLVGTYPIEELDNEKIVYLMTGMKLNYSPYVFAPQDKNETPLLEVRGLTKAGKFKDISFQLRQGEILGITGLIGSGRTEIVHSIFGVDRPDSGSILIEGRQAMIRNPRDAIKHRVALLSEDRHNQGLFEVQSIESNTVVTILSSLLGKLKLISPRKVQVEVEHWIQKLRIKVPGSKFKVNTLSGGNQQKVVVAKWLATEPRIFILDGPTIGIDVGSKHAIHELIRSLAQRGMGIIIISDEIQEVLDNCNRILLISEGRIKHEIEDSRTTSSEQVFSIISGGEVAGI